MYITLKECGAMELLLSKRSWAPPEALLRDARQGFRANTHTAMGGYRGTSLTRKHTHLGPYHMPMPRVLGGPRKVGVFLWARYPCTAGPFLGANMLPRGGVC